MRTGVSLALLATLLWATDRSGLASLLGSLNPVFFSASLALYVLGQALSTYRWQLLLEAEQMHIPFRDLFGFYLQGMFFNLFLPTLIGGDVVRGHRIYQATGGKEASLASVLMERLTGFAALLGIALLALFLGDPSLREPGVSGPVLLSVGAFALGTVALFHPRLQPFLEGLPQRAFTQKAIAFTQGLQRYRGHGKVLGQAVALSLVFQSMVISSHFLAARALGLVVPLGPFFLLVPLVVVIAMIPVSLGGLGIREGAVIYLFGKVGMDPTSALAMALAWFFLILLAGLPGGVLFTLQGHRRSVTEHPGG